VVVIVAALGALAACQVTQDEDTADQALTGDACSVQMPTPKLWDGSKVPPAGENEAWVLWPDPGYKLTAATDGPNWLVARIDTKAVVVRNALLVGDGSLAKFVAPLVRGRIIGPGTFPPPGPCNVPLQCGRMMFAYAQIAVNAVADAQAAALACDGK